MLNVFARHELSNIRTQNEEIISPEPIVTLFVILLDDDFVRPRFRYIRFQPEGDSARDYLFTGAGSEAAEPEPGLRPEVAFGRVAHQPEYYIVPFDRVECEGIPVGLVRSRVVARGSSPLPL
jgi:hypothetical protein